MTGPILLGLGIASSLLMYMFFNAFGANNNDYGGGYGDGFFRNHFKKVIEHNRSDSGINILLHYLCLFCQYIHAIHSIEMLAQVFYTSSSTTV